MTGILYISDLRGCPFLSRYTQALLEKNENYKIILWNRENGDGQVKENDVLVEYASYQDTRIKKAKKVKGFLEYGFFLSEQIRKYKFDKLIVLCTLTGVLVAKQLLFDYKGKYIFDIRDISFERFDLFRRLEKRLIDNSFFTAYSSNGFLELLPDSDKMIFCPNLSSKEVETIKSEQWTFQKKTYGEKLNLVYVGAVRQYENVKRIVDVFGNHPRFEVFYHGAGDVGYKDILFHIEEKGYTNIHFTGKYDNSERLELLRKADLLNNFYAASNDMKYANTNKYLDALICHIPLVSNLQTHDGVLALNEHVGLAYDDVIDPDILYEDYFAMDKLKFNAACDIALEKRIRAEEQITLRIRDFLESR